MEYLLQGAPDTHYNSYNVLTNFKKHDSAKQFKNKGFEHYKTMAMILPKTFKGNNAFRPSTQTFGAVVHTAVGMQPSSSHSQQQHMPPPPGPAHAQQQQLPLPATAHAQQQQPPLPATAHAQQQQQPPLPGPAHAQQQYMPPLPGPAYAQQDFF